MTVQEFKTEADEDPVEIREWSQKTIAELAEYESFLEELEAQTQMCIFSIYFLVGSHIFIKSIL